MVQGTPTFATRFFTTELSDLENLLGHDPATIVHVNEEGEQYILLLRQAGSRKLELYQALYFDPKSRMLVSRPETDLPDGFVARLQVVLNRDITSA